MSREPEDQLPFEDELSAYLDGALDPEREAQVNGELARSPALAARLAELREVDARLKALPAPPVPGDLRARLQQRIEAQARPATGRGRRAPIRRSRWLSEPTIVAAAVTAAAVALMVLVGRPVAERPPEPIVEGPAAHQAPTQIVEEPAPQAPTQIVEEPAPQAPTQIVESTAAAEPTAVDLAAADDEELEIAMDWEMLEDLDVIEELDLLEEMVAQADRGRG